MISEVGDAGGRTSGGQVGGAGAGPGFRNHEAARDQVTVGQRADSDHEIDWLHGHVNEAVLDVEHNSHLRVGGQERGKHRRYERHRDGERRLTRNVPRATPARPSSAAAASSTSTAMRNACGTAPRPHR